MLVKELQQQCQGQHLRDRAVGELMMTNWEYRRVIPKRPIFQHDLLLHGN